MHEMSLMYKVILLVSKDAKLRGFQKVTQIQVIVGDLSQDIYMLSTINQSSLTPQILQRIWDTTSSIHFISELLANQALNCYGPTQLTHKQFL